MKFFFVAFIFLYGSCSAFRAIIPGKVLGPGVRLRSLTATVGQGKSRYANEEEKQQAEWELNYRKKNGALALKQKLKTLGKRSIDDIIKERQSGSSGGGTGEGVPPKRGGLNPFDILKGLFLERMTQLSSRCLPSA